VWKCVVDVDRVTYCTYFCNGLILVLVLVDKCHDMTYRLLYLYSRQPFVYIDACVMLINVVYERRFVEVILK